VVDDIDIIPPKNTNVLYDKMKEWASNPQILKAMGARARLLVEQRFDRTVVWKNALNEYLRLVDSYKN
jgi:glycosyltransferase involved in cell wall biosynthesis